MPKSTAPEEQVEVIAAVPEKVVGTQAEQAQRSLIDKMRDYLSKQEKVEVRVHNDADVFVQIQGYSYLIQPGVKVKVPRPVAELLDEAGYL
jgi:predicted transcriptional regulator